MYKCIQSYLHMCIVFFHTNFYTLPRSQMPGEAAALTWRPRLRVLCLHGRQQTAATFRHKIAKLAAKVIYLSLSLPLPLSLSNIYIYIYIYSV